MSETIQEIYEEYKIDKLLPFEEFYALTQDVPDYTYKEFQIKQGSKYRTITEPGWTMKRIQRALLPIFDPILLELSMEGTLAGCKHGHSAAENAAHHVTAFTGGPPVVLKMDLKNYFPSCSSLPFIISLAQIALDYPSLYKEAQRIFHIKRLLFNHHGALPIGAPTSSAVATITGYSIDCKINKLIVSEKALIIYTRYIDDLTFSMSWYPKGFQKRVTEAVQPFQINHKKSQLLYSNTDQQKITGVVVNDAKLSVGREFKQLLRAQIDKAARDPYDIELKSIIEGKLAWMSQVNKTQYESMNAYMQKRINKFK